MSVCLLKVLPASLVVCGGELSLCGHYYFDQKWLRGDPYDFCEHVLLEELGVCDGWTYFSNSFTKRRESHCLCTSLIDKHVQHQEVPLTWAELIFALEKIKIGGIKCPVAFIQNAFTLRPPLFWCPFLSWLFIFHREDRVVSMHTWHIRFMCIESEGQCKRISISSSRFEKKKYREMCDVSCGCH
jgi:hypothetical protein